jgi:hypothetical protein
MIKCFATSKHSKLRRQEEEALSLAVRSGKLKASALRDPSDDNFDDDLDNKLVPKSLLELQKRNSKQRQRSRADDVSHYHPNKEEYSDSTKDLQFLVQDGDNQKRLKSEKFLSIHGDVILKKKIVHTRRTRSCSQCKFRDWTKGDVCYLKVRNSRNSSSSPTSDNHHSDTKQEEGLQVLWLCPDCALLHGMPEEHYHWNRNRMPPVPDPVIDITMNRELSEIDPDDVEWVTAAQRRPKPMNWKSQYTQYYDDLASKREREEYICAPISQDPENLDSYIAAATACSERSKVHVPQTTKARAIAATACYVPDYEHDNVQEACYMYLGDL